MRAQVFASPEDRASAVGIVWRHLRKSADYNDIDSLNDQLLEDLLCNVELGEDVSPTLMAAGRIDLLRT